jgi:AraC-like DNA-binding protein
MSHAEHFRCLESADGPALIAFVVDDEAAEPFHAVESEWHSHVRGQFFYLEKGLITVRTRDGAWTLPPHRVGWLPPGALHTVRVAEASSGWGVYVAPCAASGLPEQTCVLNANDLMRALVHRAATWSLEDELDAEQERVLAVLMDEMRRAPQEPLHLNMPSDRRLLRIAHAVLERPDDVRRLEDWAAWAGLSPRTVTRLFRSETGTSFAQWRQQARLTRALERLAGGESVAGVADALGYASVSAFVAMFRRSFGQSPGRYFARQAAAS